MIASAPPSFGECLALLDEQYRTLAEENERLRSQIPGATAPVEASQLRPCAPSTSQDSCTAAPEPQVSDGWDGTACATGSVKLSLLRKDSELGLVSSNSDRGLLAERKRMSSFGNSDVDHDSNEPWYADDNAPQSYDHRWASPWENTVVKSIPEREVYEDLRSRVDRSGSMKTPSYGRKVHTFTFSLSQLSHYQSTPKARRGCVVDPNCFFATYFEVCSLFVLLWDLVTIPYFAAFDTPVSLGLHVMNLGTLSFWCLDMGLNFFKGFYHKGELELRLKQICKHYLRTWFLVDASVNTIAVVAFILENFTSTGDEGDESALRIVQMIRMARLLRLFQVVRVARLAKRFEKFFPSETTSVKGLASLCSKLVIVVLLLNHAIACMWFGIGRMDVESSDTGISWLDGIFSGSRTYRSESPLFQYTTALHWSITQMTPGSMDVVPQNSAERIFTIVILFISLLVGALLISQLSAKMVSLMQRNMVQRKQKEDLQRYLEQNNINRALMTHVKKQIEERMRTKKRLMEKDVSTLSLLSSRLSRELHVDAFQHLILQHPLFRAWGDIAPGLIIGICDRAVELFSVSEGDEVFNPLSTPDSAYFVLDGQLQYTVKENLSSEALAKQSFERKVTGANSALEINKGAWVSEIALWSDWTYSGSLEARTTCELLRVNIPPLLELLKKTLTVADLNVAYCKAFGEQFREGLLTRNIDVIADHSHVVQSMPRDERLLVMQPMVSILEQQLSDSQFEKIRKDLADGKCMLTVGDNDRVHRTVLSAAVLVCRGRDGHVLAKVAEFRHGAFQAKCKLPSTKIRGGELRAQAARRVYEGKIPDTLACDLNWGADENQVEMEDEKHYGMASKYITSIFHCCYGPDTDGLQKESQKLSSSGSYMTSRSRSRKDRRGKSIVIPSVLSARASVIARASGLSRRQGVRRPIDAWEWAKDVLLFTTASGKLTMFMWLAQEDFDFLCTSRGEEDLKEFCADYSQTRRSAQSEFYQSQSVRLSAVHMSSKQSRESRAPMRATQSNGDGHTAINSQNAAGPIKDTRPRSDSDPKDSSPRCQEVPCEVVVAPEESSKLVVENPQLVEEPALLQEEIEEIQRPATPHTTRRGPTGARRGASSSPSRSSSRPRASNLASE